MSQIARDFHKSVTVSKTLYRVIRFAMLSCNDIIFCFVVLIRMESAGSAGQVILKTYDGSVSLCLDQHGTVVAMVSFKRLLDIG